MEKYNELLKSHQQLMVRNAELQDLNDSREHLIDHYKTLWISHLPRDWRGIL